MERSKEEILESFLRIVCALSFVLGVVALLIALVNDYKGIDVFIILGGLLIFAVDCLIALNFIGSKEETYPNALDYTVDEEEK